MIDTDKYESMRRLFLDFIESASDEVDEEAWRNKLTMLDELLAEVQRLREERKQIRELLAEVLPRKDGVPHMGTILWGLESELKSTTSEIAIILGMAEREEE